MANRGERLLTRYMTFEEKEEYLRQLVDEVSDKESDNEFVECDDDENHIVSNDCEASDAEQETAPPEYNLESESDDEDESANIDVLRLEGEYLNQAFVARDGTEWKRDYNICQTLSHNIMRQRGGPHSSTKDLNLVQTFKCFISNEMRDIIIRETNRKAHRHYAQWNADHPDTPKQWKLFTEQDFDAYIGILLMAGVSRSNYEHTLDMWKTFSNPLYRAAMGLRRFWEITKYLRFDNELTRAERITTDKAAPIRDLFEMLNSNLRKNFTPYEAITVDEQLYPFRGRTKFTQYIPSKPAKYGIKVWWICDAKTAYPLQADIYTGKLANDTREVNQGERVVKQLIAAYKNSGRTLTIDNFFTSLPLAKELMRWKLGVVGTLRKNKPYIPKEFQATSRREILSSEFGFHENVTMFVPKKK